MAKSVESSIDHTAPFAIDAAEVVEVSVADFVRILNLLESPPNPNAKLRRAMAALPSKL